MVQVILGIGLMAVFYAISKSLKGKLSTLQRLLGIGFGVLVIFSPILFKFGPANLLGTLPIGCLIIVFFAQTS
jgi:hypothetical protein